jgi:hypothetical protein
MRGRFRESELVETPPHRAEIWFSLGACCPLPASGARDAANRPYATAVTAWVGRLSITLSTTPNSTAISAVRK